MSSAAAEAQIETLLKQASQTIKGDAKGAVAKLQEAYAIAEASNDAFLISHVAEELARGWARRKSSARSLYYASKAPEVSPERKSGWATLAKTCELIANRTQAPTKQNRARALYRGAASAFKKAAALTKDPEDKRWLIELAQDAAKQAKPPTE